MIDPELLAMLRCPVTGSQLQFADEGTINRVNDAIASGAARDRVDQTVSEPIDGGLVSTEAGVLYPIRDAIPTLIPDEAIRLPGPS